MARARNLKPGFFGNEDLAECTLGARLCFAGLWTIADREGRLEDRPKRIKALLFPFDSIEVEPMLAELARYRFILRYEVGEQRLIWIPKFRKHQNPHHREAASALPTHPDDTGIGGVPDDDEPQAGPGLGDDVSRTKPGAEAGSNADDAQGQPQAGPGLFHQDSTLQGGQAGLNPSSLNPSSLNPEKVAASAEPGAAKVDQHEGAGVETWRAYAVAFRARYQADPVRSAKVNTQVKRIVAEIGSEEAPKVAAFYVGMQDRFYVDAKHPIALLERDLQKVRTTWATGSGARRGDYSAKNYEEA